MTGGAPPLKKSGYTAKANTLDAHYAKWATHYNACEACAKEDWYTPDTDLLCPTGMVLFLNWSRAATRLA